MHEQEWREQVQQAPQWQELIRAGVAQLAEAGVESTFPQVKWLAEASVEKFPESFTAARSYFFHLLTQRAHHVPLAHLLGKMRFRYLELEARPGVFIVRPETELVAEAALNFLAKRENPLVVDLCSGSGAIALALATECPRAKVYGVEISAIAYESALRNNARYGNPVIFLQGDARTALCELAGQVDLVITNPPYIPAGRELSLEVQADPEIALFGGGARGEELPRQLIAHSAQLLNSSGALIMEHDDTQGAALRAEAKKFFAQVQTGQDYNGRERWLYAEGIAADA